MIMEPIVPVDLFPLVNGRVLPPELNTFVDRNINPTCHTNPLPDIFHYSSNIIEGKCWVCMKTKGGEYPGVSMDTYVVMILLDAQYYTN